MYGSNQVRTYDAIETVWRQDNGKSKGKVIADTPNAKRSTRQSLLILVAGIAVVSLIGYFAEYQNAQELAAPQMPVSRASATITTHAGGCQTYAGGPFVKNKKVFDAPWDTQMSTQFKFTINSGSSFGNMIQTGGHGDDEYPAVFFHNNGPYVSVQFEKQGTGSGYWAKELRPIAYGTEYLIQIDIDGLNCKIYLDGALKHDFAIPSQFQPTGVTSLPVYASGDWNNAASGTISDLSVCVGGTPHGTAPTQNPTTSPTKSPTPAPSPAPTGSPTPAPTGSPTPAPTGSPTPAPTGSPTPAPTGSPTPAPTGSPTPAPTGSPTPAPTGSPTPAPTGSPTPAPTGSPTPAPTGSPTPAPTGSPTPAPTGSPTPAPTGSPTPAPTGSPTPAPTGSPTPAPTSAPTEPLCRQYNGGDIVKNKLVFDMAYTPVMDVTFYVTIDPTSGFGNVIQLGGHGDDEFPAVFFNKGTPPNYLDVQFEKQGHSAYFSRKVEITTGIPQLLRVLIQGLKCTIFLNGQQKFYYDIPSQYQPNPGSRLPVYASGDWNNAAKGKLGVLRVCSDIDPSPLPVLGCQKYIGGPIVKNKKVLDVPIKDQLSLDFKFTINSNSGFGNIVQLGGHGDDEWPAIFFHNSGTDYVTVQFERQGNSRYYAKSLSPIVFGREYSLKVDIDGLNCKIYLDGVLKHDFTIPSEFKPRVQTYPLYASGNWNNPANGAIAGLSVCSNGPFLAPSGGGSCVAKMGSTRIGKGIKLFDVDLVTNYDVIFYVKMDSNSGNGPILWLGNSETDEQPEIYYYSDGDVDVEWDTGRFTQYHYSNADIYRGREYLVKVAVRGLTYELFVNGASKGKKTMGSTNKGNPGRRGVWSYPSWKTYSSLRGTVRDVKICAVGGSPPPPPPSGGSCKTRAGTYRISRGFELFRATTTTNYDLTFRVQMDTTSSSGPIVWVGDNERDEQPEVYWFTDGDVDVEFEASRWTQYHYSSADILKGREYSVKVSVRGLNYELFVNGASKGKRTMSSLNKGTTRERGVWAYPSWKSFPSLRGTLKDVKICTL